MLGIGIYGNEKKPIMYVYIYQYLSNYKATYAQSAKCVRNYPNPHDVDRHLVLGNEAIRRDVY